MAESFVYPVELENDAEGTVLVRFPDFPHGLTGGANRAEALAEAADCLGGMLAFHLKDGTQIPPPSQPLDRPTVAPPALIAAKAALHAVMGELGTTGAELGRLTGTHSAVVRRWLDPGHPTEIATLEAALAVLGRRLEVHVRAA